MSYKILVKKFFNKLKGSFQDPFLCLGAVAVVLFGIISLCPGLSSASLSNKEAFYLLEEGFPREPYLSPANNFAESPEFLFVQETSLKAILPPIVITSQVLGVWLGEGEITKRNEITEYVVEQGDSLWAIAERFNISLNTLLWANNINSLIVQPGQKLLILPVSGVMHLVKEGDTLGSLAEKYKTDVEKIIEFNDLKDREKILVSEVLVVPDGKLPSVSIVQTPTASPTRLSTNNFYGQSHAFPYGQCTWWVAQKRPIPAWGHAKDWLDNAIRSGYSVCKGSYCIPQVGAVISLKGNIYYGHVAYVEEVKGDKVVFSETNYIGLGKMNYRTLSIGSSSIKGYIY